MKLWHSSLFVLLALLLGAFASCGVHRVQNDYIKVYEVSGTFGDPAYDVHGVSAAFAGRVGDQICFAGGANFPNSPAAKGGQKEYYDAVFLGSPVDGRTIQWHAAGKLPKPLAYGVSMQLGDTLYLAGGESHDGAERGFYMLTRAGGNTLAIKPLAPLPFTISNAAGAVIEHRLFLIGGMQDGKPSSAVWSYDIDNPSKGWHRLPDLPHARGYVQPVAASVDDTLFVSGGFYPGDDKHPATVNQGIHSLDITAKVPYWRTGLFPRGEEKRMDYWAGGTLTPVAGGLIATGGVHKAVFEPALERLRRLNHHKEALSETEIRKLRAEHEDYMTHPEAWYQFTSDVYYFSPITSRWFRILSPIPSLLGRAGASAVAFDVGYIYLLQGELKPGVRSPKVVCIEVQP